MSLILEDRPWVVFDGECVLCNRFVGVLLTHERSPELRFATTRSRMGRALASRHGLTESDLDKTYLVVRRHQAWTRSDSWIELMSLMRAPRGGCDICAWCRDRGGMPFTTGLHAIGIAGLAAIRSVRFPRQGRAIGSSSTEVSRPRASSVAAGRHGGARRNGPPGSDRFLWDVASRSG